MRGIKKRLESTEFSSVVEYVIFALEEVLKSETTISLLCSPSKKPVSKKSLPRVLFLWRSHSTNPTQETEQGRLKGDHNENAFVVTVGVDYEIDKPQDICTESRNK